MKVIRKLDGVTLYSGSFDQCRAYIKGFDAGAAPKYVDLRMLDGSREVDYHALDKETKQERSHMRVLKPLSKTTNNQVTAYYTGGNGTYCSVCPTQETADWLRMVCEKARWMGFAATGPLDQHVTVVHSKKGLTLAEQTQTAARIPATQVFYATVSGFTHWKGHDNEGYVVLELDSPDLHAVNTWMRNTFDLPVSFDDYRAHVTIAKDAYSNSLEYAQQLCDELTKLPRIRQRLAFSGLRVEDLK